MNNPDVSKSDLTPKEEDTNGGKNNSPKPKLTTSSWTKSNDPRIIRVSKAFGGKDRHSKVCTVRGLRDRRVRLSVPTAIQLYDLQDRLGLNQPSKVVDWLLDVAKHEIDELPPLQIPLNFTQGLHSMINVASHSENLEGGKASSNGIDWEDYWNNANKSKGKDHFFVDQSSHQSSSVPVMFNNVVSNGSFLKLNPSNLSLSPFGSYGSIAHDQQQEDTSHNCNNMSGSQFSMYPPTNHDHNSRNHYDPKQLSFEMLSSSSSSSHNPLYTINQGLIRPFHLSMNPKPFPSEENEQDEGN